MKKGKKCCKHLKNQKAVLAEVIANIKTALVSKVRSSNPLFILCNLTDEPLEKSIHGWIGKIYHVGDVWIPDTGPIENPDTA